MKGRIRRQFITISVLLIASYDNVEAFSIRQVVNRQKTSGVRQLFVSSNKVEIPRNSLKGDRRQVESAERKIVKLGRIGKTDEALALYEEEINSNLPTTKLMNLAIDACARARPTRLTTAVKIFNEGTVEHKLKPNVFSFGALMSTCARARNVSKALKLLSIMEEKYGVKPNAVIYGTAISACERSSPVRYSTALNLLDEACNNPTIALSPILFNTAMSACARAGEWQQAITVFNSMQSKYGVRPDEISYATVMAACERCGKWEEVLRYADLCERQFILDGVACSSALKACQRLKLSERAISYLDRMKYLQKKDINQRTTKGWKRRYRHIFF